MVAPALATKTSFAELVKTEDSARWRRRRHLPTSHVVVLDLELEGTVHWARECLHLSVDITRHELSVLDEPPRPDLGSGARHRPSSQGNCKDERCAHLTHSKH